MEFKSRVAQGFTSCALRREMPKRLPLIKEDITNSDLMSKRIPNRGEELTTDAEFRDRLSAESELSGHLSRIHHARLVGMEFSLSSFLQRH